MLLEINGLKKYFVSRKSFFGGKIKILKAVDGISFSIKKGETFSLVGESGCGKTTAARAIIRIYDPTEGQILYNGADLTTMSNTTMHSYRKKMQMIFQDPYSSLDPRMTVGDIIGEALLLHGFQKNKMMTEKIRDLVALVGLKDDHIGRYPHEFSGGQRQRIGIARALAVDPEFIICDEPISALDVSIQAQIVNMLEELQEKFNLTYLFVSHDLSMVRHISHRVAVMYLGRIVEIAPVAEIYNAMKHPYTKALLSAVPIADPKKARASQRIILEGDVPSPMAPPSGCAFRTRCPKATSRCATEIPELHTVAAGHAAACHYID